MKQIIFLALILPAFVMCKKETSLPAPANQTSIPAFISYVSPVESGATIDESAGITNWAGTSVEIQCYFYLANSGKLNVALHSTSVGDSKIQLSLNGKDVQMEFRKNSSLQTTDAGDFDIPKPGYYCIRLKGISKIGAYYPSITSFIISGDAAKDAQFNTQPRRNAASVHLWYATPSNANVEWFYNEVTVPVGCDPLYSFFMAEGFSRGYFGIQVNSASERRVLFSVWDSGNDPTDISKQVTLIDKGKDVITGVFGNEGTGGQSYLVYPWVAGQTYRFLLHAQPETGKTLYTAYFYLNDTREWKMISSLLAPKDGDFLTGLYSFVEDWDGTNGQLMRKAIYSDQWIVTDKGQWIEINKSSFDHDDTGNTYRLDYGGGVENGGFCLFNGGFVPQTAKVGDIFTRPSCLKPELIFP